MLIRDASSKLEPLAVPHDWTSSLASAGFECDKNYNCKACPYGTVLKSVDRIKGQERLVDGFLYGECVTCPAGIDEQQINDIDTEF